MKRARILWVAALVFAALSNTLHAGVWVFPDSSQRLLTSAELESLSADELWRARNEIFARKGLIFQTERGRLFAASLGSAYSPRTTDQNAVYASLNQIEKANVHIIKRAQDEAWIFPDSSQRLLTSAELQSLSADELWRARNEIFARKGLIFQTERGRAFTASLGSAYSPRTTDQDAVYTSLNQIEKANVHSIIRAQDEAWIFPDSSQRLLTSAELQSLSADELWRARNEIFAREGLIFQTERGRQFAASLGSAYSPRTTDQDAVYASLNQVERENVLAIKRAQETAQDTPSSSFVGVSSSAGLPGAPSSSTSSPTGGLVGGSGSGGGQGNAGSSVSTGAPSSSSSATGGAVGGSGGSAGSGGSGSGGSAGSGGSGASGGSAGSGASGGSGSGGSAASGGSGGGAPAPPPTSASEGEFTSTRWPSTYNSPNCKYSLLEGTLSIDVMSYDEQGSEQFTVPIKDIAEPYTAFAKLGGWHILVFFQMKPGGIPPPVSYGDSRPGGIFTLGFDTARDASDFLAALGFAPISARLRDELVACEEELGRRTTLGLSELASSSPLPTPSSGPDTCERCGTVLPEEGGLCKTCYPPCPACEAGEWHAHSAR